MELYREDELVNEEEITGEEYLLAKASEQGFVTYSDILTAFPHAEENLEELEDILATLMETGIEVGVPEVFGYRHGALLPAYLNPRWEVEVRQVRMQRVGGQDSNQ